MRNTHSIFTWSLLVFVLLSIGLAGCGGEDDPIADGDWESSSDGDEDTDSNDWIPDGDTAITTRSITVHLFATDQPYLYYSGNSGQSWSPYPGTAMDDEDDGWWVAANIIRNEPGQLYFLFNDGAAQQDAAQWLKPKGEENCDTCQFRTSLLEVWVKDGLMYDTDPDTPTDGDASDGDQIDGDTIDGDAIDGDSTDGDVVDGDTIDGDITDGDVVDGDVVDGDVADGDIVDGDITDGDVVDGDVVDGDVVDGDITDGDIIDGDIVDGDVIDGDLADGDVTDGDVIDGDSVDGDLTDGDIETAPTYRVHYYTGWIPPYIHYSYDAGTTWTTVPGEAMSLESGQWWVKDIDINPAYPLYFVFNDGGSNWDNPNLDPSQNYETSAGECWVKDGVVYTDGPPAK